MINGINIILDEPYPTFNDLKPNKKVAYQIKQAFCGQISEMNCINDYIYQHLIINEDLKDIKEVLKKIAIVEITI